MNVPELRFPEFSEEWEEKKLADIANFSKGKGISKKNISEEGIPCIRYGELYTTYKEKISDVVSKTNLSKDELVFSSKNDIIIPTSGETAIDLATASCVINEGIGIGGDTTIIKTKGDGLFFSYYLNSKRKNIAKLAQGVSVVHLYSTHLKILDLKVPRIAEQEKIASFLSKVDEKIEKLEKKQELWETYKKGMMQKIFSQELRFKDENGEDYPDWEKILLGDIGSTYTGLSGKTKEDFGKGNPFITYKSIFDKNKIDLTKLDYVDVKSSEKQNTVKYGDIFFTTSSETPEEVGMASVILENVENCYLNSFCFGFRLNSVDANLPDFMSFYLRSPLIRDEIKKLAQGSTRYNLSKKEMMKLKLEIPLIQEQLKIANFLSDIDLKLDNMSKELKITKEFKKGLLKQMFC